MGNIFGKLAALGAAIVNGVKAVLSILIKSLLDILFRVFDLILPLSSIAGFVKKNVPGLWRWLMSLGFIKRMISRNIFRQFGDAAPARPHAFTMAAPYACWYGFVDRNFTGRHLPPDEAEGKTRPQQSEIVDLFIRGGPANNDGQIDCVRSTVMFAAFAQWFTDSFLRTDHAFKFDGDGNVIRDENGAPVREPGREQRNTSNHEIDLCQIYGLNERQTDILRLKDPADPGCLKFENHADGEYPPFLLNSAPQHPGDALDIQPAFKDLHPDERILRSIFLRADHNPQGYETIFATGLEHSNATIGNALLNTIFLREHNRVARLVAKDNPDWNDERVFQTARNVMIVLLLKIVISDYIRHISPLGLPLEFQPGFASTQGWYRANRISIEFNLLYRWHGLVPDRFSFMPNPDDPNSFRHNNHWLIETGVGKAVTHFSGERAGRIVIGNTPTFLRGVKADTVSIMRDAKLASYNEYRERFGMSRAKTFADVTRNDALAGNLSAMYGGKIDDLEWYVGMMSEDHGPDRIMGELLLTMVAHDAFSQALTNPLLADDVFNEETFSPAGWDVINKTSTLDHIVQRIPGGEGAVCTFSRQPR
jgi:prostaglandin-endoperoxide synthase 2